MGVCGERRDTRNKRGQSDRSGEYFREVFHDVLPDWALRRWDCGVSDKHATIKDKNVAGFEAETLSSAVRRVKTQ
jgi:hypothetical protein